MTTAKKPATLAELAQAATQAEAAAREARNTLAEQSSANYNEGLRRRNELEDRIDAAYNEEVDAQAAADAAQALRDAILNSDIGRALLAYAQADALAEQRWRRHHDRAIHRGDVPADHDPGRYRHTWPSGRRLVGGPTGFSIAEQVTGLLGQLAAEAAEQVRDADESEHQALLDGAYEAADPATPTAWRVTLPHQRTLIDRVGSLEVPFIDGVAFIPAEHADYADFYRRDAHVEPVGQIPEDWAGQVRVTQTFTAPDVHAVTVRPATSDDGVRVRYL